MDYKRLHNTSSVDLLPDIYGKPNKRRRQKETSNIYEVEKLVTKRCVSGVNQYLVKWLGWSRYEASWEDEDSISEDCIEYFNNPTPVYNTILESVAELRQQVECFLKGKGHLAVPLHFPHDVFLFLFHQKGVKQKGWYLLGADCFPVQYFPVGWDKVMDVHGQGVQLGYPVRVRSYLSWSPRKYHAQENSGAIIPSQRCYTERMTFKAFRKAGSM